MGLTVDDMSILHDFKPTWMRMEHWKDLIEIWNTPEWKAKCERIKMNREKSIGGKHTLGSQTFVSAKLKVAKIVGHEFPFCQMWRQSHCKKGFRPLDNFPECTSSVVEDIDSEEDVEEQNLKWVDERSHETWKTYEGYLEEKYGNDTSKHPEFDPDLWSRAVGGKNKGKIYGLSNVGDPLGLITGTPSTPCSSTTYIHEVIGVLRLKINRVHLTLKEKL